MNYYKVSNTENINEIGNYPQTKLLKGYDPTLPNSHWNVLSNEFPEFTPNYELELLNNSIATDYLDVDSKPTGIFVSEKLKKIIETFNLPPHRFYKIKVIQNKKNIDYYWFHYIVNDFWEYVDLNESMIEIYHMVNKKHSEVLRIKSINNIEILKENLERGFKLRLFKIIFKNKYPYDIYKISNIIYEPVIVSESLLNALQEEGMTGFTAKPYDVIETV